MGNSVEIRISMLQKDTYIVYYTYNISVPYSHDLTTKNFHGTGNTVSDHCRYSCSLLFDCPLPMLMESSYRSMHCQPCRDVNLTVILLLLQDINHIAIKSFYRFSDLELFRVGNGIKR